MLELAVASRAETFDRIGEPLAERDIRARHVETAGRTFRIPGRGGADTEFAGFDVGYVYPPRVTEGGIVDALLGVPWVNGRSAVLASRNKGGVLATLDVAGVPVPETVVVSNPVAEAQLVRAFERFEPPVVVKPNSTSRGVGVARAPDLDTFLGIVDYLALLHEFPATRDRTFLLQEHLPDARDYRVMVVDGEYAGAVERRLPEDAAGAGRWKHNVHRAAEAVRADPPSRLRRLAERTARVLGIDLLGVDLLVTDDRAVVSETNARPTIDDAAMYASDFYDRLAALIRRTAAG